MFIFYHVVLTLQRLYKLAPKHFISKASHLKLDLFHPLGDESFHSSGEES